MQSRRSSILAILILFLISFDASAQRCGTGLSSESGGSAPGSVAQRNVALLFDGIALNADDRKTAIRVFENAWNSLVKLDYRAADYRQRFDALLVDRNQRLLALAKSGADSAKLLSCFAEMHQPVPSKSTQAPSKQP